MLKRRAIRPMVPALTLLLIIGILWELVTWLGRVPEWFLPAPSVIAVEFVRTFPQLMPHTIRTLIEVGLGYAIAFGSAFIVAGITEKSRLVQRALDPLLVTSQTIPIFALAPLLAIWFGFGIVPKILIVALVCFFPIAVSLAGGLRSTDPEMVALVRSMGADSRQVFLKVKLPSAIPSLLSGMKIAASYSVIAAVIAEWIGASHGLGLYMLRASNSFQTARVFAAIGVVSALSIALFLMVDIVGRFIAPWIYVHTEESIT